MCPTLPVQPSLVPKPGPVGERRPSRVATLARRAVLWLARVGSRGVLSMMCALGLASVTPAPALAQSQATPPQVRVGDHWRYLVKDGFTGDTLNEFGHQVVSVSEQDITVQLTNKGSRARELRYFDRQWNATDTGGTVFEPHYPEYRFPLVVGDSWREPYRSHTRDGKTYDNFQRVTVEAVERIHTPAGDFDAYRIKVLADIVANDANQSHVQSTITTWYAPTVNKYVRREVLVFSDARVRRHEVTELSAYGHADAQVAAGAAPEAAPGASAPVLPRAAASQQP